MASQVTQTIESGITLFSAAEISVAVITIGEIPAPALKLHFEHIAKHRQVELQSVRSFYKEQQKSPFKSFPWKNGCMTFKFLPEAKTLQASPLSALHTHRKVLGVFGVCHCPNLLDLDKAYARFEQVCRAYPDAFALRCLAFEPDDKQLEQDRSEKKNLIVFPPSSLGGRQLLDQHLEVVMHDFAGCLLAELERWMLNASPAMVDLNTFVDTDRFMGPSSALEEVSKRLYNDEELVRKRRYGRLQKAMGDYSLLAGSPADAGDHYATAVELLRTSNDFVWLAAALEGVATTKVLAACVAGGFRGAKPSSPVVGGGEAEGLAPHHPRVASLREEEAGSAASSKASSGYGGLQFWAALRSAGLEQEVRALLVEAKAMLRRKGALPCQLEQDFKLARFLAGLHGTKARREVSEMMTSAVECIGGLVLQEDRLTTIVEAAQVMGLVGSGRKRQLLLWQAVEQNRAMERPNLRALQIAREALEPPADPIEPEAGGGGGLVPQPLNLGRSRVPWRWGPVRCACVEGVLTAAIVLNQHADVWDAAACLLREHYMDLPSTRQASLLDTLGAASGQMGVDDRVRPGLGPPPLITFLRAAPPPAFMLPLRINVDAASAQGQKGPFIFTPFAAKDKVGDGPVQWVCGETASVEVEISNPSTVSIKVERLTLEAELVGSPEAGGPAAPRDPAAWKPSPVALWLPPETAPTKVSLSGVPLRSGLYVLTGCRITVLGVAWHSAWSPRTLSLGQQLRARGAGGGEADSKEGLGGLAAARITVLPPLPLLEARIDAPPHAQATDDLLEDDSKPPGAPTPSPAAAAAAAAAAKLPGEPRPQRLQAFRGQVMQWRLALANVGKLPITSLNVTVVPAGPGGSAAAKVTSQVDQEALKAALPLRPGVRTSLPFVLHATQLASGWGGGAAEEAAFSLRLDYVEGQATEAAPQAEGGALVHLGRRLGIPTRLTLHPSLQITSASFLEHHAASPIDKALEVAFAASEAAALRSVFGSAAASATGQTAAETLGGPADSDANPAEGSGRESREDGAESSPMESECGEGRAGEAEERGAAGGEVPRSSGGEPAGGNGAAIGESALSMASLGCSSSGQAVAVRASHVLELEVHNRTDLAMQVWLGPKLAPEAGSVAWRDLLEQQKSIKNDYLSPRKVVSPKNKTFVLSMLSLPNMLPSEATGKPMGTEAAGQAHLQQLARHICDCMVLYWQRVSEQGDVGIVQLPRDIVAAALTPEVHALLRPGPVSLQLAAKPPEEAALCRLQPLQEGEPAGRGAGGSAVRGALWGAEAAVGRPLQLLLRAANGSERPARVRASLTCTRLGGAGLWEHVPEQGAVILSGEHAGAVLEAAPHSSQGLAMGVCFLQPGVYQLRAQPDQGGAHGLEPSPPGSSGLAAATVCLRVQ